MNRDLFGQASSRRAVVGFGLAASLGACGPVLPGRDEAPQVFRLTRKSSFESGLPRVKWALAVAEPTAERALDTNRIAVIRKGLEVEYYAASVWTDRAPSLIQNLLVQSFLASERIGQVATDRDRLRGDFLLRTDLRAFHAKGTTVRVAMGAQLLALPRRDPIAQTSFEHEEPTADATVDSVVLAFDEALGKVVRHLVGWTLRAGSTVAASDR